MTDSTRRRRVLLLGATAAAVVALELVSGGTAWASWTAPAQVVRATATTGSVAVGIRGGEGIATTYSSAALSHGATVTVLNSGSVPATTSLALSATAGSALSGALRVDVWHPTTGNPCSGSPSTAATTGTGTTIAPVVASLDAGGSTSYCVRTSVGQGQRFDLSGGTTTLDATVTARQGAWTGTAHARATQTVAATVTPTMPSKAGETDSRIALTWGAPADTVGIGSYAVYRDGVLVGTTPASVRSFTDTGLQVSTYYAYTVRAVASGAAGHVSPPSPGVQHATGWFTSTGRYALQNDATGKCIAAGGTTSGSPLTTTTCSTSATQTWRFTPEDAWLRVSSSSNTSLYWDAPSDRSAVLRPDNDISAQKWTAEPVGAGSGLFRFRNRNDLCLTAAGGYGTTHAMTVADCGTSGLQLFSLRATS
ncbi:ricin-type beta-trefoil lectin domain protein [Curtobacterium aurantiacum]|uniref:ricin-type beta-trefoil lectin domain protein n=1 Tax=Curtobacterium aurantiacum TaxID=3236919 RepID=UPI001BDDF59E|nr:ricin-type beta-trefoil lectin domain protein [Curtobacterium flaccumfaciens]MBT1679712.1 ricin-type beta-trefoil lectin domain protein [Curtobacterium flaccumfaciens pv. flaccumfaciens]